MNNSESFEINLVGGVGAEITKESLKTLTIEDLKLSLEIMNNKENNSKYNNWTIYNNGFKIEKGNFRDIISKGAEEVQTYYRQNEQRKHDVGTHGNEKIKLFKTKYLKMFQDELISRLNLKEEIMNLARSSFCKNNELPDFLNRDESIANIKAAIKLI